MEFKKKLKIRLYIAIAYIAVGLVMAVAVNILETENNFLSSFGIGLIVCGIVRVRNYFRIAKNEETIRKQEIAETDERNIAISNRAKSAAFAIYLLLTCTIVVVLEIMNKSELATILSLTICALVLLYCISYWIIRKRS